jgi:UDP-N-acetylglucosamine--N-acetylmuramyl-(pentapeptide) pyrophosphoryl-undecaprenol N-acetylglucosamine transferase
MPDIIADVLIAGGGSGGHIAPALAIAENLQDASIRAILACSERAIDQRMLESAGVEYHTTPARPLRRGPVGAARFALGFARAHRAVSLVLLNESIDAVVATGGFVAAPALRAARQRQLPTVLLNLDSPPGRANRLATRWADVVLSSVDAGLAGESRVNIPLRTSVIATGTAAACRERLGLKSDLPTLLVTGASQGASTINMLIPELAIRNPMAFHGWQVLHVAGDGHVTDVQRQWETTDVPHRVIAFQDPMGDAWGAAELAVSRGGANTIAEIAANTVPSLVLPYPWHADRHQWQNAAPLERLGGIVIVEDRVDEEANIAGAGAEFLSLMDDRPRRESMRAAMSEVVTPNGAAAVTAAVKELLSL